MCSNNSDSMTNQCKISLGIFWSRVTCTCFNLLDRVVAWVATRDSFFLTIYNEKGTIRTAGTRQSGFNFPGPSFFPVDGEFFGADGEHSTDQPETATTRRFLPNFSRQASQWVISPFHPSYKWLTPRQTSGGIDISMDTNTSVTTGAVVAAVAVNASVPLQINEQHMAVDPITSKQRGLRIGGSRSTLISRLTGIPATAPAPAAVDSTQEGAETVDLTIRDSMGRLPFYLTPESIKQIMATINEGENYTLCRLSQLARVCSIMRNILNDRLTHGVRKWGQIFLGSSWHEMEHASSLGVGKFDYNEKKPNCGLPKLGTSEEWWRRLAHVFQGQRRVYQHFYTSLYKEQPHLLQWEQRSLFLRTRETSRIRQAVVLLNHREQKQNGRSIEKRRDGQSIPISMIWNTIGKVDFVVGSTSSQFKEGWRPISPSVSQSTATKEREQHQGPN
ncbi:hypothetical protein PROFUN_15646 [Planoprotostelium fungivorum]|uniref:Uncharacterized protein n=1 Tax=Planoprotostelium fungivorum TaxID=1890364 RepID=A0A2P6MV52_9EUKA|nr:hypothetical protein PROFUN_15646 [Planoprotostelium fungivorum]